jgi:hypothetical protein
MGHGFPAAASGWKRSSRGGVVKSGPGRIPLVILAGSDLRRGFVPEGARDLHFVVAYKGAELSIGGRPLAQILSERIQASGAFGAIYLAGPRRVYAGLVDCEIIDTDGHLGENLQAAIGHVAEHHGPDPAVGFIACDVLPLAEEIAELAALLAADQEPPAAAAGGRVEEAPALAIALIHAGQELGVSAWKPKYLVRSAPGRELEPYLPAHLGIARPARLRTGLCYRLSSLVYRERNRGYSRRRRTIFFKILGTLIRRDLLNLFRLLPPTLTYTVLRHGLGTFARWRRGDLDLQGLAFGLAAVLVRRKHFRRRGAACVRVVTSHLVSFAKDLDTQEEVADLEQGVREGSR